MFVIASRRRDGAHKPLAFGTPPAEHPTVEAARREAERLAGNHPEKEFFVFAPVSVSKATAAPVETVVLPVVVPAEGAPAAKRGARVIRSAGDGGVWIVDPDDGGDDVVFTGRDAEAKADGYARFLNRT